MIGIHSNMELKPIYTSFGRVCTSEVYLISDVYVVYRLFPFDSKHDICLNTTNLVKAIESANYVSEYVRRS